jgi:hypothetical protein
MLEGSLLIRLIKELTEKFKQGLGVKLTGRAYARPLGSISSTVGGKLKQTCKILYIYLEKRFGCRSLCLMKKKV